MAQEMTDELTTARAKRAEIAAKLEAETDKEDQRYYALVLTQWDIVIARLEAKHATRETAVQPDDQPGELSTRGD